MNKVSEIVTAWAISFNPNDDQKKLADGRYEICLSCDKRKKRLGIEICGECGCPLSKKIFTQKLNESCPLRKWDDIDKKYRKNKKRNLI